MWALCERVLRLEWTGERAVQSNRDGGEADSERRGLGQTNRGNIQTELLIFWFGPALRVSVRPGSLDAGS